MLTKFDRRKVFLVMYAPFVLNDLGFIFLDRTYTLYIFDYLVRLLVLFAHFTWLLGRATRYDPPPLSSRV